MANVRRTHRCSQEIHHWLASKFLTDVADPVLRSLRVVEVEVSPDLRSTKVHFVLAEGSCVPGGKPVSESQLGKAFLRVTPYLRRAMGQELGLRFVPELRFILDESFDSRHRLAIGLETGSALRVGEMAAGPVGDVQ